MNGRGRWVVLALAALASGSLWWLQTLDESASRDTTAPPHRIDYTMEQFDLTVMDTSGKPQYRLQAATMQHYADDDSSEFVSPRVEYVAANTAHLKISAEHGWMAAKAAEIRLEGAVRIEQRTPRPFTLVTRDVRIDPARQMVSTRAPATFTGPGLRIDAVGMTAWIDQQRVELQSQVKGRYDARVR